MVESVLQWIGTEGPIGLFQSQSDTTGRHVDRRSAVGELKDKAKGLANEVVGEAKQQSDNPNTAPRAVPRSARVRPRISKVK
jgi:hypothetical protein